MHCLASAVVCVAVLPLLCAQEIPVPQFSDTARRTKLATGFPETDKLFETYARERGAPGLVYGIVIDGELAHLKAMGVCDRKSQAPVTADTVFRIASMTKSFTVLAVLKLRDEGKLSLDHPVAKYIPEFSRMKYPTGDTAPITIRQLMTHGAGFPEDNPWGDRQMGESEETLTAWLREGLPFSTAPDTAYEYSNYGFALLGRIVTAASKTPYRQYLEKQILQELGMRSSTLEPSAVPAEQRAVGYSRKNNEYVEEPSLPHGSFGSMGGLLTSANDLAKYVAFQLSAFPARSGDEKGPVRRSSVREMQQLHRRSMFNVSRPTLTGPLQATAGGYGYGLGVSQNCSFEHIVGHGGGLPGWGSFMMWLPEHGVGMFAMTNLTYAGPSGVMNQAFEALRKTGGLRMRELAPSPVLQSTRDAIVKLWQDWSDDDARKLAANNLFLDQSAEVRRKEIERLKNDAGACRPEGPIRPENLLRGSFRLACERGTVDVTFTLAPTQPPTVQYLRFALVKPLTGQARVAAEAIISHSDTNPPAVQRELNVLEGSYGKCKLGETLGGDGSSNARVRLNCERGAVDLQMRLDEGKLLSATFTKPADVTCVQ